MINRYKTPISVIFEKLPFQLLVEKELAHAHYILGNIPESAWKDISEKCSTSYVFQERVDELEKSTNHDIMALVYAITEQCEEGSKYIHLGATSMDIQDTTLGLQLSKAKEELIKSLNNVLGELARLTETHRNVVAIGRTHGQHALPLTQGFKFANFLSEFLYAKEQLFSSKVSYGKLSGAIGTYASYKTQKVEEIVLANLGLEPPVISTQVIPRVLFVPFLSSLVSVCSTSERLAKEIRNLQRPEIGEWFEGFSKTQVGSSAMPHKRNPHKSERICGLSRIVRNLFTAQAENIALEHERDLTNSAPERIIFEDMITLTDFILVELEEILQKLQVDNENVSRNLYLMQGRQNSEAILMKLAKKIGRQEAHELLNKISNEKDFISAVKTNPIIKEYIDEKELEELLDPNRYTGLVQEKIEQVLGKYQSFKDSE